MTLYNVRDFAATPKQVGETLKRIANIGYTNVQVSGDGFASIEPAELKNMADDAGISIIGCHTSLQQLRTDISRVISSVQTWGCSYTAISSIPLEYRQQSGIYKKMAAEFTKYGTILANDGIVLQYHNHHFEFQRFGDRCGLEILYLESDPRYLQAELDLGWIARGGADPAAWVKKMKGRTDQVHIKDWAILGKEPIWTEVGSGNLNWSAIIQSCKAVGVKHYIVEQDNCPITNDPFKSLDISYKNLLTMGLK